MAIIGFVAVLLVLGVVACRATIRSSGDRAGHKPSADGIGEVAAIIPILIDRLGTRRPSET